MCLHDCCCCNQASTLAISNLTSNSFNVRSPVKSETTKSSETQSQQITESSLKLSNGLVSSLSSAVDINSDTLERLKDEVKMERRCSEAVKLLSVALPPDEFDDGEVAAFLMPKYGQDRSQRPILDQSNGGANERYNLMMSSPHFLKSSKRKQRRGSASPATPTTVSTSPSTKTRCVAPTTGTWSTTEGRVDDPIVPPALIESVRYDVDSSVHAQLLEDVLETRPLPQRVFQQICGSFDLVSISNDKRDIIVKTRRQVSKRDHWNKLKSLGNSKDGQTIQSNRADCPPFIMFLNARSCDVSVRVG